MGAVAVGEVVSSDGSRIGFERVGEGRPLVLVHGSTADRSRWAPVVPALAQRFEVVLVDRRGRGLSRAEADGDYAIDREAEDLVAVADAVGEGAPVGVVGHSFGGLVALEAA